MRRRSRIQEKRRKFVVYWGLFWGFRKKREKDQEEKDRLQQEQIREKKRKEEMALQAMKMK